MNSDIKLQKERQKKYKKKTLEQKIEEQRVCYNIKIINQLKHTNMRAYKEIVAVFYDRAEIDSYIEDGLTKVKLSSSDLFEAVYGPIIISFKGDIKAHNIVDISVKSYLEACHRSMPITYCGLTIPNTAKDKFKVDFMSRQLTK